MLLNVLSILTFLLLFWALTRSIRVFLISPIYIFVGFYSAVLFLSPLYHFNYPEKFSLAGVDEITNAEFWQVWFQYLHSLIFFMIGTLWYYENRTKRVKLLFNRSYNSTLFTRIKVPNAIKWVGIILVVTLVLFYAAAYGGKLFYRSEYIPDLALKALVSLAKILSFIAGIVLGLYYSKNKTLSSLLIALVVLANIATGSRVSFVVLVLFFLVRFISSTYSGKNLMRFSLNMSFAFVLLSFVMTLRKMTKHGLGPYLEVLYLDTGTLLKSIAFNLYYTFVFGLYATQRTLELAPADWKVISLSLNPLLGKQIGWYNYVPDLMITPFMPYTFHGQVFNMGPLFSALLFLVIGSIFCSFERRIRQLFDKKKRVFALVLVLLLALFVFYSFEYHLRSAVRYIYYSYFVLFVAWGFRQLFQLIPKKTNVKTYTSDRTIT